MKIVRMERGMAPLIVSLPHAGTWLPAEIADAMTPVARRLPDTDWHVERLYAFAGRLGATVLAGTHSRYVIDLNRAHDDSPLYPGQDNTELCPLTTFDHEDVYLPGQEPGKVEIARRIKAFWRPYHDALAGEIQRLRAMHDRIILWEGHTIRSRVPRFFDGRLPGINIGTGGEEATADAELLRHVAQAARDENVGEVVCNGRFKGGYITRRHGRPSQGVHALQLELAQVAYMEEAPPFRYLEEPAARLSGAIERMIGAGLAWIGG